MNSKNDTGQEKSAKYAMTVRIGSIRCALIFRNREYYEEMERIYSEFLTEGPSDITIDLELTDRLSVDNLRDVLPQTIYTHKGGYFWTTSQIVSGKYDLSSRMINITAERSLGNANIEYNHLNRLMTMAYYSGCKIKYNGGSPPAMMLHACGIIRHGKAIIFAGPSEVGKTTVASLCGERFSEVINDEMVLISRPESSGTGVNVHGIPIIGGTPWMRNVTIPLSRILLLKQSGETRVNHLDKSEVYLRLIRQVVNPAYIGQKNGRDVYSLMADFSAELVASVPVDELEFTLDERALWRTIEEIEETQGSISENDREEYISCR
jgi:hypothetical protein